MGVSQPRTSLNLVLKQQSKQGILGTIHVSCTSEFKSDNPECAWFFVFCFVFAVLTDLMEIFRQVCIARSVFLACWILFVIYELFTPSQFKWPWSSEKLTAVWTLATLSSWCAVYSVTKHRPLAFSLQAISIGLMS